MSLLEDTKKVLQDINFSRIEMYDQNFLIDETILEDEVIQAKINKDDTVLEIGPGTGNLTVKLSKKAKNVLAIEIDDRFKGISTKMGKNVEIIFRDALDILRKDNPTQFNKVVANIPYNMCEPLMHYLIGAQHVELSVLTVPKGFAFRAQKNPIFSSFLNIKIIREVPKEAFYPCPQVNSVMLKITQRPSFEADKDDCAFICRKLYLQESKKLKNSLREALIDLYYAKHHEQLNKKNAKAFVDSMKIDEEVLNTEIRNNSSPLDVYKEIAEKVVKMAI